MTNRTESATLAEFRRLALDLVPGAAEAAFSCDEDAALVSVAFTVPDPAMWADTPDGLVVPAGELERSLTRLGWDLETGLTGPVRDDVTYVEVFGPGETGDLAALWAAASAVWADPACRDALPHDEPLPLSA